MDFNAKEVKAINQNKNLAKFYSCGSVTLRTKDKVSQALSIWERLAYQVGGFLPHPEKMDMESIVRWGMEVLLHSSKAEGDWAPSASVTFRQRCQITKAPFVELKWEGTFTSGREIVFQIYKDDYAAVIWESGTGKVSTFLTEMLEALF